MKFTEQQVIEALREASISENLIESVMRKLYIDSGEKEDYVPLKDFDLSKRVLSSLSKRKIETVKELKDFVNLYGSKSLKTKIRDFGETAYQELKNTFSWIKDFE